MKRCYEKHRAERLAYQKSYYDSEGDSIRYKAKLRRIFGDDWRNHYDAGEAAETEGGKKMSDVEKKWPGWKIITDENVSCVKCGKRIKIGVLARCDESESEMVCEVCFGRLRDEAEKLGKL